MRVAGWLFFFFFSSRRRHTRCSRDWSSDVCSSDLESKPMNADDQVCVAGLLEGGAALSIHYRGGHSRGTNLLWEINGTEGDLQVTADGGQAQIFEMTVRGRNGAQSAPDVLPVPQQDRRA